MTRSIKAVLLAVAGIALQANAGDHEVSAGAAPTVVAPELSVPARVERAMFGEHRSADNIARNRYRHPVGTLHFFGLEADMTVMEIWPSSGWYTEVLAPVMRDTGELQVAAYDTSIEGQPEYRYRLHKRLLGKFEAHPGIYDQVEVVPYSPPHTEDLGEPASVDMVLTFRNLHGWVQGGIAADILADFFTVLKPGGTLGIVQHRADAGADPQQSAEQGYVPESHVREIAESAGFVFEASSEVNANPADTHDHPEGVGTLPPSLRLGEEDKEKYLAIGESDRMTLRFTKPE